MTPAERLAAQKARREGGINPDTALLLDALQALRSAVMEMASRPIEVAAPTVRVTSPQAASPSVHLEMGPVIEAVDRLASQVAAIPTPAAPIVQVPPPPEPGAVRIAPEDIDRLIKALSKSQSKEGRATQYVGGGGTREGLHVRDFFRVGEALAPLTPGGSAVTASFAQEVALVVVRPVGGDCFVDPFGGTAASGQGIYVPDGEPAFITFTTSRASVWAPPGVTVYVHAFGYPVR